MGPSARWLAGGWAALILALATVNVLPMNHDYSRFLLRKAGHLGLYAMLALLLSRALASAHRRPGARRALGILVLVAAVGSLDELCQAFVPGRSARVADVGTDLIGGAVGLILVWALDAIRRLLGRRHRS